MRCESAMKSDIESRTFTGSGVILGRNNGHLVLAFICRLRRCFGPLEWSSGCCRRTSSISPQSLFKQQADRYRQTADSLHPQPHISDISGVGKSSARMRPASARRSFTSRACDECRDMRLYNRESDGRFIDDNWEPARRPGEASNEFDNIWRFGTHRKTQ